MPQELNLDGMTADELWEFWEKYNRPKRKDARELVGDRRGYIRITSLLASYASNKSVAMRCRENGDILAAEVYERICEQVYSRLPEDIRW